MKNCIHFLFLLFFVYSCSHKEKYQGKWRYDVFKSLNNCTPRNIQIGNDSIKFNFWSFDYYHKYALKIKKDKLIFNNWTINSNILKDTLSFNNLSFFIKDTNDSILKYWRDEPMTKIKLPQKNTKYFSVDNYSDNRSIFSYILFGKRIDNNEFSLQLNDKYSKMQDLPAFIVGEIASVRGELTPFLTSVLYVDKSSPMKYLEDIFYNLKIVNGLKISLVNDIKLRYNDALGVYYEFEQLDKRLPPRMGNDTYFPNTSNELLQPPPLPLPLEGDNSKIEQIYLKKNKVYYKNQVVSTSELAVLLKPWIKDNRTVFSLYDLESTYGSFLEMNAVINSVYNSVRGKSSKIKFKKPLEKLNRAELTEIKKGIQMRHIWSYSIPHYESILKYDTTFFGIKIPNADTILK